MIQAANDFRNKLRQLILEEALWVYARGSVLPAGTFTQADD
jgi:hypothetical protein